MDLNSVSSINTYTDISSTAYSRTAEEDKAPPPFPGGPENMDISGPGRMMNAMSQMSEEERTELKAFHDEVMEAVKNGTFDASEMAENAPESLTQFAEENGLDVEQMIEGMAQGPQGHKGPPPPPPMMYGADGKGISSEDDEDEVLTNFLLSDDTDTIDFS